ncbi:hypothetical protein [Roseospira visakhapatnamensis]|uniref:Uncharacterized protein n=1 Tax=Roseospira visakhapatnamensis TaxID=390880 RepID=A0A7W6RFH1_9PROT|nr:hypothetical protein [Roseospira visakhapatnamensis]MBB4267595.1 hypothetical protein [Roseospira visakhapatnamensis]
MITTIAGPEVSAGAGEVVTVTPTLGAALVETGAAVPLAPDPKPLPGPECAIAPPAETATAPPQRRRGRAAPTSGG